MNQTHKPAAANTNAANAAKAAILPGEPEEAARMLIKISRGLLQIADRETQALVQNDLMTFAILQDEKEMMTARYKKASQEFRARLEEFRGMNSGLLNQLSGLQNQLSELTQNNNQIVVQIKNRAERKTHNVLLTAQELGQKHRVHFDAPQRIDANNTTMREERV